ncbi:MAG: HutD family protein [Xanthomonadales bacterium]|nr:HutD family protein [Xanthomonadales bacterium]
MLIRLADCPTKPWKNGQGRTRELVVFPDGAGMDEFDWRVSIAEVDSAAPFSRFPGIDRCIVLLDGAGFTMRFDDGHSHALTTPLEAFEFAGEASVSVALSDGPTRDFNLMLRRGRIRGNVHCWHSAGDYALDAHDALLYCVSGQITFDDKTLNAGDSWLNQSTVQVRLHHGAKALVVKLETA